MPFVYRFCDANDSTTCLSNAAQQGCALPNSHWQRRSVLAPDVLKRAYEHMDGKTANSPFVSVATDVIELVKWGCSGGLLDIIYGVDHPERRAPHIVRFQVPEASIISPDSIVTGLPGAAAVIGLARSRKETELLYFGNDMKKYQVSFVDNPYTNESYQTHLANEQVTRAAEQKALEDAEELKLQELNQKQSGKPKSISTKLVKEKGALFNSERKSFLQRYEIQLSAVNLSSSEFSNLDVAKALPLKMGPIIRRFDESILQCNDDTLKHAWLTFSQDYRQ